MGVRLCRTAVTECWKVLVTRIDIFSDCRGIVLSKISSRTTTFSRIYSRGISLRVGSLFVLSLFVGSLFAFDLFAWDPLNPFPFAWNFFPLDIFATTRHSIIFLKMLISKMFCFNHILSPPSHLLNYLIFS